MARPRVLAASDAAELIPDGAIVTVLPLLLALALNGWHWAQLRALASRSAPLEAIPEL